MWPRAVCVALLALAAGYLFVREPELPGAALRYLAGRLWAEPAESSMAAAWEALITRPARPWSRVAVG